MSSLGYWLSGLLIFSSPAFSHAPRSRAVIEDDAKIANLSLHSPSLIWGRNVSGSDASLNSSNRTSASPLHNDPAQYSCDGGLHGRNLNLRSCLDALSSIADYDSPQTFGERGKGTWDINLPFRFLSGECSLP